MVATADGRATLGGRTQASPATRTASSSTPAHPGRRRDGRHATIALERYGPLARRPGAPPPRRAGTGGGAARVTASRTLELPVDTPLFRTPSRESSCSRTATASPAVRSAAGRGADRRRRARSRRRRGAAANGHGVRAMLHEGGPTLLAAMLAPGLVDELFLTVSPMLVGGGEPALVEGTAPRPAAAAAGRVGPAGGGELPLPGATRSARRRPRCPAPCGHSTWAGHGGRVVPDTDGETVGAGRNTWAACIALTALGADARCGVRRVETGHARLGGAHGRRWAASRTALPLGDLTGGGFRVFFCDKRIARRRGPRSGAGRLRGDSGRGQRSISTRPPGGQWIHRRRRRTEARSMARGACLGTAGALTADDTDSVVDIYERSGETATLLQSASGVRRLQHGLRARL